MCWKRWSAVSSAAGLALLMAACAPATGLSSGARSPVVTPGGHTKAPAIGILIGTSPADHDLKQASTWISSAWVLARAAGQSRGHVVIDRFGSGPGSSQVTYNAQVASTTGQNALTSGIQVHEAEKAMTHAFRAEQASVTPGPTDLISGVSRMAQHLQVLPHTTTDVVIFGDAVQTATPVNLADPVELADPRATLHTVVSSGLLSRGECRGWRVYMVDGSLTPVGGLSSLQDEQLREFWREFFAWCGGRLVVWDTTLIAFPASGQVPPAAWTRPGHRQVIVSLPASVLFPPNQAILLPSAAQVLGMLARKLTRTYPHASATIAGYTAAVAAPGPPARMLSWARARAVAAYLEATGVRASRLSVHGYGDRHQIATDATAAGQARNRRVVVTLQMH